MANVALFLFSTLLSMQASPT